MKRKIFCLAASSLLCLFMSFVYTYSVSQDLHDNIIRLHVIANSNSDEDQKIKYLVRDEFLKNSSQLKACAFSDEYMIGLAREVLEKSSAEYTAKCSTGDFYFPQKSYENITMPAGVYKGVKIILGNGAGENWWCVLSPPMCFTKSAIGTADTSVLGERLEKDTIDVITDGDGINYKFKLVETIKKFMK